MAGWMIVRLGVLEGPERRAHLIEHHGARGISHTKPQAETSAGDAYAVWIACCQPRVQVVR